MKWCLCRGWCGRRCGGVGGSLGREAGDGGLGGEEVGWEMKKFRLPTARISRTERSESAESGC